MSVTTTVEIQTKDGDDQLVVTKTLVETSVYTRNRNRTRDQIPLGICLCDDEAFEGRSYQTSTEIGLEALIKAGLIGRPVKTYCVGEHIEVTYRTEHGTGIETAVICTNHTHAVILTLIVPKRAWCCDPRIEGRIRKQNPAVSVRMVTPTTDGNGRQVYALPLVLHDPYV